MRQHADAADGRERPARKRDLPRDDHLVDDPQQRRRRPTRISAVALTLPMVATTSAKSAGYRQPPARAARAR